MQAREILNAIHGFNQKSAKPRQEWGFYECGDYQTGKTVGVEKCSWSAAGAILLQKYLEGKKLWGI